MNPIILQLQLSKYESIAETLDLRKFKYFHLRLSSKCTVIKLLNCGILISRF